MGVDFDARTDGSYTFEEDDIYDNRIWGILAYFLFFIPLIFAKESKFARFHANQGLLILIVSILCGLLNLVPIVGMLLSIIAGIAMGVLPWLKCLWSAIQGRVERAWLYGTLNIIRL